MTAAALAVLPFVRGRFPAAVLVLSGFCWSLPMYSQTAFHDYYVLFHVGVPLVVFAAAAAGLRRLAGDRAAVVLSAAALAVFVLSNRDMSGVGHDAEAAREHETLTSDFESIRRMTVGHPVYLPGDPLLAGSPLAVNYFLAGSVLYKRFLQRPRPWRLRQEHRLRCRGRRRPARAEEDRLQLPRAGAFGTVIGPGRARQGLRPLIALRLDEPARVGPCWSTILDRGRGEGPVVGIPPRGEDGRRPAPFADWTEQDWAAFDRKHFGGGSGE